MAEREQNKPPYRVRGKSRRSTSKTQKRGDGRKNPKPPNGGEPATVGDKETEAESPQHITPTRKEEKEKRHITAEAATHQKKIEQERDNHTSAAIPEKGRKEMLVMAGKRAEKGCEES